MSTPVRSPRSGSRIAIAGAGAAGLACALALARAGHAVTLIDAAAPGRGALWASAGMLAPGFETLFELDPGHPLADDFAALCARGGALWAAREAALAPGHARPGGLGPRRNDTDEARAGAALAGAARFDVAVERLSAHTLHAAEPALGVARGGLRFPTDGQIDNRALGEVWLQAFRAAGGEVIAHAPVRAVETHQGRASARALSDGRRVDADLIVLAAGTGVIDGAPALAQAAPVQGQMIAWGPPAPVALTHVVRHVSLYLAAKPDGRGIAGATSEPGQAGLETDADALAELSERAGRLVPALAGLRPDEAWAGLRPRARDGMPVIGEAAPGLILAGGGYRNGVLLAPVIADAIETLVRTGSTPAWARAFTPDRAGLRGG
ncbi:MAG: FAD-dependent oxidoreductase [Oceanicaulis sp.]|nr:FAD-dependent oxidoreductase [Oceanicaulis sp.]